MTIELARTVADAVLYEGYLLYPYRATSTKNQTRWQFGVLGPPGAAVDGVGEEPGMSAQCLIRAAPSAASSVTVHLRFLQLQQRSLEQSEPATPEAPTFRPVTELSVDGQRLFGWDEAVEHEVLLPTYSLAELAVGVRHPVAIDGGQETESVPTVAGSPVGRIVRRRWPVSALVKAETTRIGDYLRLTVAVDNVATGRARTKDEAIRTSLIGAHLLLQADGCAFVSLLDPPDDAIRAVAACQQQRCWPVLAGPSGSTDVVLASPIILYDHPEVAAESTGALFDSTEIDEILTLRIMTLTDEEKAEARATDPRAREIIDRCEQMSPADLQQLHGVLRDPHAGAAAMMTTESAVPEEFAEAVAAVTADADRPWFDTGDVPWWDPAVDERVQPEVDAVLIGGVSVSKDSLVRVHPSRRADAQDLFYADQVGRVTAVLSDVDGGVHVALVLVDDPAAELHDWYGRYLYFAPDELEPLIVDHLPDGLSVPAPSEQRKESH